MVDWLRVFQEIMVDSKPCFFMLPRWQQADKQTTIGLLGSNNYY